MKSKSSQKEFVNKKANFDYAIDDTVETGIVLTGMEIKAIRNGRVSMNTSYAKIINNELWWIGGSLQVIGSEDQQRTRKLLVKKSELSRLIGATQEKGETLVPIKLYIKRGKAKLLIGLGKGKKKYDKRNIMKDRDSERDSDRIIKGMKQ